MAGQPEQALPARASSSIPLLQMSSVFPQSLFSGVGASHAPDAICLLKVGSNRHGPALPLVIKLSIICGSVGQALDRVCPLGAASVLAMVHLHLPQTAQSCSVHLISHWIMAVLDAGEAAEHSNCR